MNLRFGYERPVKWLAISTLIVFCLYGLLITWFPLLPFWIDEWYLIDNIKFKSPEQLWEVLDHTQQFPRLYLQLIKAFSGACDYSYTSLRLPSFITHCLGMLLLYRLSFRIFGKDHLSRFLWVMIYISFNTSIHYFVQVKQYTMEMALSLAGIWQFLELIRLEREKPSRLTFFLLCAGFAAGPFFSYTYPIVIAPVYLIVALRMLKSGRRYRAAVLPLIIGLVATAACYELDIKNVLADPGMQDFWKDLLMKRFSFKTFFTNSYITFCNLGSGDLFGNIFGIAGITAFIYTTWFTGRTFFSAKDEKSMLLHYSSLLLWVVLILFIAGKLPLGTFRLNSFIVAAIGLMIVQLLIRLREFRGWRIAATGIAMLLFLSSSGNVYVTMAELAGGEHARKLSIYNASEHALGEARRKKIPIVVTSGIAFPFEDRHQGDWILRTLPAYKVYDPVAVYPVSGAGSAGIDLQLLPPATKQCIVLNGDTSKIVTF